MATLALSPAMALPVLETVGDLPVAHPLEQSNALSACLLLGDRSQSPPTAMLLARYKLDLLLQGNSFALEGHTLNPGVTPRPYSYLKFIDGLGNDLSDELYLGRSDSHLQFPLSIFHEALSLANLAASIFPVHHRVLPLTGLTALFIFRNLPKGAQTAEDTHAVTFFPRAAHALLPEEPVGGSVTNKILTMELRQGSRLVGAPVTIGRCL